MGFRPRAFGCALANNRAVRGNDEETESTGLSREQCRCRCRQRFEHFRLVGRGSCAGVRRPRVAAPDDVSQRRLSIGPWGLSVDYPLAAKGSLKPSSPQDICQSRSDRAGAYRLDADPHTGRHSPCNFTAASSQPTEGTATFLKNMSKRKI